MRRMETENPQISLVVQMGRTEQGRDIFGIRIASVEHLEQETLPIIFVTAGASARDWITVMSAVNLIHVLIEQYSIHREIVDDLEWIILPVSLFNLN